MNSEILNIGTILKEKTSQKKYRILAIVDNEITLCQMEISQLKIFVFEKETIVSLMNDEELIIINENPVIFDTNSLSTSVRERYEKKRQMMNEVVRVCSPSFNELLGKKPKPEIEKIMKKYGCARTTFWRVCTAYFQSGMKNCSLVDTKALVVSRDTEYKYNSKPGRKPEYFVQSGVVLSAEVKKHFEEALKDYKSGRQKTLRSSFEKMSRIHYTRVEIINGVTSLVLMPQSERPTFWQFYYYVRKNMTKQEKDLIKTSAQEQRNNKRLINSDSFYGVYGPGDMVEIDACEADVSLVSMIDKNRTIGRPIVYFMIDVYTRIILAVSVAFDNNSILGITNLFLNLADDKKTYCARFGMGFDNEDLWPSNIIPRRIRVDRGSEFKSKEFDRICNELGIEKQMVPGASGSLKGVVEQSFHQMHLKQNLHMENYGLIEKRYDSNHHQEATLNIEQYTKMVINFVLSHNQRYSEQYPVTREMIEQKIDPIPAKLWQYGVKKYGSPRPIPMKEQYLYSLMTPVKAKLSRKGISYKDLWYSPSGDKALERERFNAGNKKIPFEVRMDMRDISNVYYLRDGRLITAPLNERLTGNGDYKGLTMKQYEDYRKAKAQSDAKGRIYNEDVETFNYAVNEAIIDDAKKPAMSDFKEMRPAREIEKQHVSNSGKISKRLEDKNIADQTTKLTDETPEEEKSIKTSEFQGYGSWQEALEDMWENS